MHIGGNPCTMYHEIPPTCKYLTYHHPTYTHMFTTYLHACTHTHTHTLHISHPSHTHSQMSNYPDFREPMKKREWTFSKFVDELKSHIGRTDEYIYYQDTLTDAVGTSIKHDFVHFNWRWLNDRKKRYNWGQLTTNLLLIGQPGNITPCHYDEQHNFFCEVG